MAEAGGSGEVGEEGAPHDLQVPGIPHGALVPKHSQDGYRPLGSEVGMGGFECFLRPFMPNYVEWRAIAESERRIGALQQSLDCRIGPRHLLPTAITGWLSDTKARSSWEMQRRGLPGYFGLDGAGVQDR
jgi:hypothetical protein